MSPHLRLEETNVERDLGVMIWHDMKPSNPVQTAVSKANMVLSLPGINLFREILSYGKNYTQPM